MKANTTKSDAGILKIASVVFLALTLVFFALYRSSLIWDYPAWDDLHILCGVAFWACFFAFLVTGLGSFLKEMISIFPKTPGDD